MKKIYQKPNIEVVCLNSQEIMNGSSPNLRLNLDGSVNAANVDARQRGTRTTDDDFDDIW